jgi:hypothetical protein
MAGTKKQAAKPAPTKAKPKEKAKAATPKAKAVAKKSGKKGAAPVVETKKWEGAIPRSKTLNFKNKLNFAA